MEKLTISINQFFVVLEAFFLNELSNKLRKFPHYKGNKVHVNKSLTAKT